MENFIFCAVDVVAFNHKQFELLKEHFHKGLIIT